MANDTYKRLGIGNSGGTGEDDKRVKVSNNDGSPEFLEEKILPDSAKILIEVEAEGLDEKIKIDVNEAAVDHDSLANFEESEHKPLDDDSITTESLWSSQKIKEQLDDKINAATPMTDNKLVKSVGTSGVDVEATGIDVDDSDNVTGINNLTVNGDLTVLGSTTEIDSELTVTDASIIVNNNGNQASANAQGAGIEVEMSDATNARLEYDSTTVSKFRVGEIGDTEEILTTNHSQTVLNKDIDADNNTISNLELDNLKTGVLQTDISSSVSDDNIASSKAVKDYVDSAVLDYDDAQEISYVPTTPSDWSSSPSSLPSNVQEGLDQLADRSNTTETNLNAHLDTNSAKHSAFQIQNIPSGSITSTDVQSAINELEASISSTSGDKKDKEITDTVDPTVSDDSYDIGQLWINTDTDDTFILVDNSLGDAKWIPLSVSDRSQQILEGASNSPVAGFILDSATVRAFDSKISVEIEADNNLFEFFEVSGVYDGVSWLVSVYSTGSDSNVILDVDNAGQLIYTSDTYSGFNQGFLTYEINSLKKQV